MNQDAEGQDKKHCLLEVPLATRVWSSQNGRLALLQAPNLQIVLVRIAK
jgi:hypothetical protein